MRFLLVALALSTTLAAQQPASNPGTGTVTGHVVCGDTGRPARFAQVTLFGVPAQVTAMPKLDPGSSPDASMAAIKSAMDSMGKTSMATAQTALDGSFTALNAAPGDYYVFAALPGYIQPLNQIQALVQSGADFHKPLPGIPTVHVTADHSVNVDLSMERGAAISGTVTWDDGGPVSGAVVSVIAPGADAKEIPPQFAMLAVGGMAGLISTADDLGHFRLSGLVPGQYVVQATLPKSNGIGIMSGAMSLTRALTDKPMVVYMPAAFHKPDAKPVTLHAGEDLRDQLITVRLSGMHTVSGHVASAEDHHGINSASIRLQDTQDKDFVRSASVDANGSYVVTFVPSGTYTLSVSSAADTEPAKKKDSGKFSFTSDTTLRSYDDAKASVLVADADVTGQNLDLKPSAKIKKDTSLADLMSDDDDDDTPATTVAVPAPRP